MGSSANSARVFCHLGENEDTASVLQRATEATTDVFLQGDADTRNAIEQGFLEHVLETATLRRYFEHWSVDERLRPAWTRALEWGEAHPDFT